MNIEIVSQKDNTLNLKLNTVNSPSDLDILSNIYVINKPVSVQMRVIYSRTYDYNRSSSKVERAFLFMTFKKPRLYDLNYIIKVTSKKISLDKSFKPVDTWHLVCENAHKFADIDLLFSLDIVRSSSLFANLYNDTYLTDFQLRSDGGVVTVHKAVLAAASPVFLEMLVGAWKGESEGAIDVPQISQVTLTRFKDYLYLRTLPATGFEHLLLLSFRYKIPTLEDLCVNKLLACVTAKEVCDLLEFAVKHGIKRLIVGIMRLIHDKEINIKEMEDLVETLYEAKYKI